MVTVAAVVVREEMSAWSVGMLI